MVAEIFDSIKEYLEGELGGTSPERFVADYINAWVDYYRTQTRHVLAIREIWGNFRDGGGQQHFGPQAVAGELGVVQQVLEYGQANDSLGNFDARVMAVTIEVALDALLNQLADDPDLDLDAYGAELVRTFERATGRPDSRRRPRSGPPASRLPSASQPISPGSHAAMVRDDARRYFTFTVMTSADQPVITSGPYRFVRHPGYTGVLLVVLGSGLVTGNWIGLAAWTLLVMAPLLYRIHVEEDALQTAFGDRYRTYASGHKRLIPLVW